MRTAVASLLAVVCLLSVLLLVGCGDDASTLPPVSEDPASEGPRLVTLAPALSQMLVDLGLSEAIVGVAEHDAAAPPGLTVVGDYTSVDTELLLATRPSHVLMMVGPDGAADRLQRLADSSLFQLHTFPFPLTIQDIGRVLYDEAPDADAPPSLGDVLGMPQQAMALKMRLFQQLAAIRAVVSAEDSPTVLMVIGTNPVMASGPGTVHDELLGFAGGLNAAADAAVTAPEYDRESLLALSPQVVLLLDPDAPALEPDDPRLASLADLPIPAIRNQRVSLINDPLVLLPSTSIGRICADMAKAIHPDLADKIDAVMAEQVETGHE